MTGKTHITSGIALSLFLGGDIVSTILVCAGTLLPDIDSENSTLGKVIPILPKTFKHRGILHSIWVPILLGVINIPLCYGYALHLLLDALTVEGIKPLYPLDFTLKIPIVRTGGILEYIFLVLLLVAIIFIVYTRYISVLF